MSDTKHSDTIFTNEETLNRRAWIDRAMSGVKGKVQDQDNQPKVREEPRKPRLYVVDSSHSS